MGRYDKEYLINQLKEFVDKNGYPTSKKKDFKSINNLPCARIYENTLGGDLADWLEMCGYNLSDDEKYRINNRGRSLKISKEECIQKILKMQSMIDRPLNYDDFRHPNKDTIGITEIKNYWGTLNKMKNELNLKINQESMVDKQLSEDDFYNEIKKIFNYLKNKNRNFITTREINSLQNCSRYWTLDKSCRKYCDKRLGEYLKDQGVFLGHQGRGFNYIFSDGECTDSHYEYIFSQYLKGYGLKFNKDYFRNIKYSDFVSTYSGNMNCDYVIYYNNRVIYIEIAGVLDNYKQWYYQNRPINNSKSKEEYRIKLWYKERLFQESNVEYFILFPCDLTKEILCNILNNNYTNTKHSLKHFYKNNIDWRKILEIGELKYDLVQTGRDKQPLVIYGGDTSGKE